MNTITSIIICTCNRAEHLRQTLEAMRQVCVPGGISAELIVVDNASTDDTARVIQSCRLPQMPVRYIYEGRKGQCYARNTGIAAAQGDVILFTDDDVRPPQNWVEGMCGPILYDRSEAVAGGVRFAPHLLRTWMTKWHRTSLADTERLAHDAEQEFVGANFAFSRDILHRIPSFDLELGPGALGFGDDSLFARQIGRAGYRIKLALDVEVEHHFEERRLLRRSFLDTARKHGRTWAYLAYHWRHEELPHPHGRVLRSVFRLAKWRARHWRELTRVEGCEETEMFLLSDLHFAKQYLKEQRRPRNYDKYGLVKLEKAR